MRGDTGMHRPQDPDFRVAFGTGGESGEGLSDAPVQPFPPMHREQDGEIRDADWSNIAVAGDGRDHGIPRQDDLLRCNTLLKQMIPTGRRGSIMPHRELANFSTVSFLRPGVVQVSGTHPRFDMSEPNPKERSSPSSRQGGFGIALHNHQGGISTGFRNPGDGGGEPGVEVGDRRNPKGQCGG